jgi:hypothetical protein
LEPHLPPHLSMGKAQLISLLKEAFRGALKILENGPAQ